MDIKKTIRSIADWPEKGVIFRDLTTLMKDPDAYAKTCDIFHERYRDEEIDKVAGIDARGFVFGAVLAYRLHLGFIPIRKKGKLPADAISESYDLEYGQNEVEIHIDAVKEGEKILLIDDLLATGGTMEACVKLVKRLGGRVMECGFVVELPDLKGRDKLKGEHIFAMTEFEGL
ncbi:adenine phosphoribosyltransferase [Candidatus Desulfarcum epimagneticum]|uniref:Adenine phosphoribosyltransferase n=1 Tax=uncultured Desulfobacteraceae bacterium TaxID=218296 RepID=A0A484HD54_9BACT|nr:adenine phosphoribosyltransferase [uncultured Desulfobacteraceae bacterium]